MLKHETQQTTPEEQASLPEIMEQRIVRRRTHEVTATAQSTTAQSLARQELRKKAVPGKREFSRRFLDALIGAPGEHEQFAELVPDWLRLMNAGMNPLEALEAASAESTPALRSLCGQAIEKARSGMSLADALAAPSAGLQMPLFIPAVIRQWERQGMPSETLRRLAVECRRLGARDRRYTYSAHNPGMILPLMLGATIVPAVFLLQNPLAFALYTATVAVGMAVLWRNRGKLAQAQPRSEARAARRLNASRSGIMQRSLATTRWANVFTACWRCGLPISESLEIAAEGTRNAYYCHVLKQAAERARQGFPLSACLAETRLLPVGLINQVKTGEVTGNLDESLEFFAGVMEGDAKELGVQVLFMRRILPMILLLSAFIVFAVGMLGGIKMAVGATVAFLIVAFLAWEGIFRQSTAGDANLGIGQQGAGDTEKG